MLSLLSIVALPLVMILGVIVWKWVSVSQGLMTRTRRTLRVAVSEAQLEVWDEARLSRRVEWVAVARARYASNTNWTESKLVEDAVTLYDARSGVLAKVPQSAIGFSALLAMLEARKITLERVEVEAPTFD